MKLAGVLVTFKPDENQLAINIERIINDLDKLIIFKNSHIEIEQDLLKAYGDNIVFLGKENNVGVAKALNESINWVKDNSFTHVLTLDQDSFFEKNHLANFCTLIDHYPAENKVGIYAPNFFSRGGLHFKYFESPVEVSDAITSGSIYPINLFSEAGGFNDELFVDCVDFEFCYRISSQFGFKIIMFPSIHLVHELGYSNKTSFGFTTINYNAFRTFYLVRNHILVWKKYPDLYPYEYKMALLKEYIFYRIIKVILVESNKFEKVMAIFKGVYYGISKSL